MKVLARAFSIISNCVTVLLGGFVILLGASLLNPNTPNQPGNFGVVLFCTLVGSYMVWSGFLRVRESAATPSHPVEDSRSVEDRLDELERLKRRDMVTPEEYDTKRQEILKDL